MFEEEKEEPEKMYSRTFGAIFVLTIVLTTQSQSWTPSRILDSRIYRDGNFRLRSEEVDTEDDDTEEVEIARVYPCPFVAEQWGDGLVICPARPESPFVRYPRAIMRSTSYDSKMDELRAIRLAREAELRRMIRGLLEPKFKDGSTITR